MMAALDAGADDISRAGDVWQVTCEATSTAALRQALEEAGISVESSDLTMLPTTTVALDTAEAAKPVLRLIDALDDQDDVQDVFANFDIPDDVLASVEA
jgi:transcriptional/translational regulatory protein YebC/TACO1